MARNPELTLDGLLLTMVDTKSPSSMRVVEYVRANVPHHLVLGTMVPRTNAPSEAFAAGQPVVLRDPGDAASQAYVNLAAQLADRFQ